MNISIEPYINPEFQAGQIINEIPTNCMIARNQYS